MSTTTTLRVPAPAPSTIGAPDSTSPTPTFDSMAETQYGIEAGEPTHKLFEAIRILAAATSAQAGQADQESDQESDHAHDTSAPRPRAVPKPKASNKTRVPRDLSDAS